MKKVLILIVFSLTHHLLMALPNNVNNVIFDSGYFIAAGGTPGESFQPIINISQDGMTWKDAIIDQTGSDSKVNSVCGIACNINACIATLEGGKSILYSPNRVNWMYVKHGYENNFSNAVFGANKFVVALWDTIIYSYDGVSWNKADLPSMGQQYQFSTALAYGNNMFLVMTVNPNRLLVSRDGISWSFLNTAKIPIDIPNLTGFIFANDAFYFTSSKGNGLISTPDLVNYNIKNPNKQFYTLEYHNNILFAYLSDLNITVISYDLGNTWQTTDNTTHPMLNLNHYAYGNYNIYVYALGQFRAYSHDAINWTYENK